MIKKLLVILLSALLCNGAPTIYDQRQDGDLNVKVDLDNFVFLIAIPSTSSTPSDIFGTLTQLYTDSKNSANVVIPSQSVEQQLVETKELDDVSMDNIKPQTIVVVQEGEKAARSLKNIVRTLRNLKMKEQSGMKDKGYSGKYKFVESVEEPQNLRLVGDAIENCGPGRSRDRLGICQSNRD